MEDIDWKDATTQVNELVVAMENTVAAALAQIKASEVRTACGLELRSSSGFTSSLGWEIFPALCN